METSWDFHYDSHLVTKILCHGWPDRGYLIHDIILYPDLQALFQILSIDQKRGPVLQFYAEMSR